MKLRKFIASTAIVILAGYQLISGQVPAFPGAEGYGKYTSGGRSGSVYEVTNLNDSGPGSFRDAVSQPNRTIVFRVSGDIELQSTLHIRSSNLTIAGQTAPGDGICVRDYPTIIREANNIIVRYMRFRLGDRYGLGSDAFGIDYGCQKVILDHCTMSWGADECFSVYHRNPQNITVQWCIVGEGLDYRGHSMGGLWGGHASYHHNLIHSNGSRHPKYNSDSDPTDSRNNVIYNWRNNSAYTGSQGKVNLVNNYYKAGPATGSHKHRIVEASDTFRMYITGNYVAGYPEITADNWNGGVDDPPIRHYDPFDVPYPIPEQSAVDAYHEVIQHVGASFPRRDDADNRAIKNLVDSTGFILKRQSDAGGFPILYSLPAPDDSDHDGMPDDWEDAEGLNKNDMEDRNGDKNGNGYTNLEDYLNSLPQLPDDYPKPGFPSAEAVSEYRINVLWYDHNTDESGFILERSTDSSSFSFLDTLDAGTGTYIDSLALPSTDYYYRVRSYNETEESVWAYSMGTRTFAEGAMPGQVLLLEPDDNQEEISIAGTTLRWEAGEYTLSFNVYFGTNESDLECRDSATTSTSFNTHGLDFGSDYYWRIDANNANGTTTGQVRKFSTVADAVPELVLYWPFREEDGNIVYDSTENQNHGTLQNVPTLIRGDGPFDRSISLSNSGPTGHIELPDNPSLHFDENPFSIAFWMRLGSVSDSSVYIFHKGAFSSIDGTPRNGRWFGLEMRDGSFRFSVDDNSTKTTVAGSTSSFVTGEWVHVVIVRDPFKQRLTLYKNKYVNKVNTDATGDISQSLPLVIGNSDHMHPEYYGGNTDENAPYRGELAEFVICRHPLTTEEIDLLYTYNRIPTLPPPVSDRSPAGIAGLRTWPNPFSDRVSIGFNNGTRNHVMLEVYDINGKLIYSKRKALIPNTGNRINWDGTSGNGTRISSGTYLLMLREENGMILGRSILMKK